MTPLQWLYLNKANMDTYPPPIIIIIIIVIIVIIISVVVIIIIIITVSVTITSSSSALSKRWQRQTQTSKRKAPSPPPQQLVFTFFSPRSKVSNSQSGFGCEVFLVVDLWVQYLSRSTNKITIKQFLSLSINYLPFFFRWKSHEKANNRLNTSTKITDFLPTLLSLTASIYHLQTLQPREVNLPNRLVSKVLMDMTWAISRTKVKTPPAVA